MSRELKGKDKERIYTTITVGGAFGEKRSKALVDTGATLVTLPPRIADAIGIPKLPGRIEVKLADGRKVKAEAGPVILKVKRKTVPATAVILKGAQPLLGAQALESLNLRIDMKTGKLRTARQRKKLPTK